MLALLRKTVLLLAAVTLAASACSDASEPQAAPAADPQLPPQTNSVNEVETLDPVEANEVGPHCIKTVCPVFTGQEILDLHERPVWSLTLLDDGTIASGDDATVRLWRLGSQGPQLEQSVVIDNPSFGRRVVDIGQGRVAVTGDSVVVADLATQEILHTLEGSDQVVRVGDNALATANTQSGLFLWDLTDLSAPTAQLEGSVVNLSSTQGLIYFTRNDTILEWNGQGEPTEILEVEDLWRVLPTPELLFIGDENGVITVVDRTTRQPVGTLEGLAEFGVSAIVQLPNGQIAASGATGDIAVWDLAKPTEPLHLGSYNRYVNALLALPDGTLIASIGGEGSDSGQIALFPS